MASLQYTIGINADTSKADSSVKSLRASLAAIEKQALTVSVDDSSLKRASAAAQELQLHLQKAIDTNTGKLNINKFAASLKSAGTDVESLGMRLLDAGKTGQQAFANLASSIAQAEIPMRHVNQTLKNFGTTLKNTMKWQISSNIIHGLQSALQSAVTYAKDLNSNLNDIRIVTGASVEEMTKFATQANKAAQMLSTTTNEYSKAALLYFQQGNTQAEAMQKAAITIKAANASFGSSAKEMSEYLTAVWNSYQVGSDQMEHYVDIMASLGAKTATSLEEIATAMQKVAATANTVGVSMEQMSSIISTVSSVTREAPQAIGTAYKTILARMGDLKLGGTDEDGVGLGQVSSQLKSIGVNILDTQGQLREMGAVIEEIGQKWQTMDKAQQTALAQVLAGKRQYTQIIALFENMDKYWTNMQTAQNSGGALEKMASTYAESWEAASKRVRAALESLYSQILNDKALVKMTNGLETMVTHISKLFKSFGGMSGVLTGVLSIMMNAYGPKMANYITQLGSKITQLWTGQNAQREQFANNMSQFADGMLELSANVEGVGAAYQVQYSAMQQITQAQADLARSGKTLTQQQIADVKSLNAVYTQQIQLITDTLKAQEAKNEQMQAKGATLIEQANTRMAIDQAGGQDKWNQLTGAQQNQAQLAAVTLAPNFEGFSDLQRILGEINGLSDVTFKNLSDAMGELGNKQKDVTDAFTLMKEKYTDLGKVDIGASTDSFADLQANLLNAIGPLEDISTKFPQLGEAIKTALGGTSITEFKEQIANLKESDGLSALELKFKNFSKVVEGLPEMTGPAFAAFKTMFANALGGNTKDLDEFIAHLQKGGNATEFLTQKAKELGENYEQTLQKIMRSAPSTMDGIVKVGQVLMSLTAAFNTWKSTVDTWKDPDASGFDKFRAAISALVSTLWVARSVYMATQTIQQLMTKSAAKVAAAEVAEAGGHAANVPAVVAETGAKVVLDGVNKKVAASSWAALGVLGLIIAAIAALIAIVMVLVNAFSGGETAAQRFTKKLDGLKNGLTALQTAQKQQITNLANLQAALQDTTKSYQEQLDAVNEITSKYGIWADSTDILTKNYGGLEEQMLAVAAAQQDALSSSAAQGYADTMAARNEYINDEQNNDYAYTMAQMRGNRYVRRWVWNDETESYELDAGSVGLDTVVQPLKDVSAIESNPYVMPNDIYDQGLAHRVVQGVDGASLYIINEDSDLFGGLTKVLGSESGWITSTDRFGKSADEDWYSIPSNNPEIYQKLIDRGYIIPEGHGFRYTDDVFAADDSAALVANREVTDRIAAILRIPSDDFADAVTGWGTALQSIPGDWTYRYNPNWEHSPIIQNPDFESEVVDALTAEGEAWQAFAESQAGTDAGVRWDSTHNMVVPLEGYGWDAVNLTALQQFAASPEMAQFRTGHDSDQYATSFTQSIADLEDVVQEVTAETDALLDSSLDVAKEYSHQQSIASGLKQVLTSGAFKPFTTTTTQSAEDVFNILKSSHLFYDYDGQTIMSAGQTYDSMQSILSYMGQFKQYSTGSAQLTSLLKLVDTSTSKMSSPEAKRAAQDNLLNQLITNVFGEEAKYNIDTVLYLSPSDIVIDAESGEVTIAPSVWEAAEAAAKGAKITATRAAIETEKSTLTKDYLTPEDIKVLRANPDLFGSYGLFQNEEDFLAFTKSSKATREARLTAYRLPSYQEETTAKQARLAALRGSETQPGILAQRSQAVETAEEGLLERVQNLDESSILHHYIGQHPNNFATGHQAYVTANSQMAFWQGLASQEDTLRSILVDNEGKIKKYEDLTAEERTTIDQLYATYNTGEASATEWIKRFTDDKGKWTSDYLTQANNMAAAWSTLLGDVPDAVTDLSNAESEVVNLTEDIAALEATTQQVKQEKYAGDLSAYSALMGHKGSASEESLAWVEAMATTGKDENAKKIWDMYNSNMTGTAFDDAVYEMLVKEAGVYDELIAAHEGDAVAQKRLRDERAELIKQHESMKEEEKYTKAIKEQSEAMDEFSEKSKKAGEIGNDMIANLDTGNLTQTSLYQLTQLAGDSTSALSGLSAAWKEATTMSGRAELANKAITESYNQQVAALNKEQENLTALSTEWDKYMNMGTGITQNTVADMFNTGDEAGILQWLSKVTTLSEKAKTAFYQVYTDNKDMFTGMGMTYEEIIQKIQQKMNEAIEEGNAEQAEALQELLELRSEIADAVYEKELATAQSVADAWVAAFNAISQARADLASGGSIAEIFGTDFEKMLQYYQLLLGSNVSPGQIIASVSSGQNTTEVQTALAQQEASAARLAAEGTIESILKPFLAYAKDGSYITDSKGQIALSAGLTSDNAYLAYIAHILGTDVYHMRQTEAGTYERQNAEGQWEQIDIAEADKDLQTSLFGLYGVSTWTELSQKNPLYAGFTEDMTAKQFFGNADYLSQFQTDASGLIQLMRLTPETMEWNAERQVQHGKANAAIAEQQTAIDQASVNRDMAVAVQTAADSLTADNFAELVGYSQATVAKHFGLAETASIADIRAAAAQVQADAERSIDESLQAQEAAATEYQTWLNADERRMYAGAETLREADSLVQGIIDAEEAEATKRATNATDIKYARGTLTEQGLDLIANRGGKNYTAEDTELLTNLGLWGMDAQALAAWVPSVEFEPSSEWQEKRAEAVQALLQADYDELARSQEAERAKLGRQQSALESVDVTSWELPSGQQLEDLKEVLGTDWDEFTSSTTTSARKLAILDNATGRVSDRLETLDGELKSNAETARTTMEGLGEAGEEAAQSWDEKVTDLEDSMRDTSQAKADAHAEYMQRIADLDAERIDASIANAERLREQAQHNADNMQTMAEGMVSALETGELDAKTRALMGSVEGLTDQWNACATSTDRAQLALKYLNEAYATNAKLLSDEKVLFKGSNGDGGLFADMFQIDEKGIAQWSDKWKKVLEDTQQDLSSIFKDENSFKTFLADNFKEYTPEQIAALVDIYNEYSDEIQAAVHNGGVGLSSVFADAINQAIANGDEALAEFLQSYKDQLSQIYSVMDAQEAAAAQRTVDAWRAAFDQILAAKQALADGETIASIIAGDLDGTWSIMQALLNAGYEMADVLTLIKGGTVNGKGIEEALALPEWSNTYEALQAKSLDTFITQDEKGNLTKVASYDAAMEAYRKKRGYYAEGTTEEERAEIDKSFKTNMRTSVENLGLSTLTLKKAGYDSVDDLIAALTSADSEIAQKAWDFVTSMADGYAQAAEESMTKYVDKAAYEEARDAADRKYEEAAEKQAIAQSAAEEVTGWAEPDKMTVTDKKNALMRATGKDETQLLSFLNESLGTTFTSLETLLKETSQGDLEEALQTSASTFADEVVAAGAEFAAIVNGNSDFASRADVKAAEERTGEAAGVKIDADEVRINNAMEEGGYGNRGEMIEGAKQRAMANGYTLGDENFDTESEIAFWGEAANVYDTVSAAIENLGDACTATTGAFAVLENEASTTQEKLAAYQELEGIIEGVFGYDVDSTFFSDENIDLMKEWAEGNMEAMEALEEKILTQQFKDMGVAIENATAALETLGDVGDDLDFGEDMFDNWASLGKDAGQLKSTLINIQRQLGLTDKQMQALLKTAGVTSSWGEKAAKTAGEAVKEWGGLEAANKAVAAVGQKIVGNAEDGYKYARATKQELMEQAGLTEEQAVAAMQVAAAWENQSEAQQQSIAQGLAENYAAQNGIESPEVIEQMVEYIISNPDALTPTVDPITGEVTYTYNFPQLSWQDVSVSGSGGQGASGSSTITTDEGSATVTTESEAETEAETKLKVPTTGSNTGSGGNQTPKASGGGGGGGGGNKPKHSTKTKKTERKENDRHHQVNKLIDRQSNELDKLDKLKSRAYGANHIKAINDEINAMRKMIGLYEDQKKEIEAYLKGLEQIGTNVYGATIIDGVIQDQADLVQQQVEKYNKAVEEWNKLSAEEQEQEYNKVKFQEAEAAYNDFLEWMEEYENEVESLRESMQEMADYVNQISGLISEQIQEKITLRMEIDERDLEAIDRVIGRWEDELGKQAETFEQLQNKLDIYATWDSKGNITGGELGKLMDRMKEAEEQHQKYLDGLTQYGEDQWYLAEGLNDADYAEVLKEIQSQWADILDNIDDVIDAMGDVYNSMLDIAEEDLSHYTDQLDHIKDTMSSYIELQQLMGLGSDPRQTIAMYETQYAAAEAKLQQSTEHMNELIRQRSNLAALYDSLTDEEKNGTYGKMLKDQLDELETRIMDAENEQLENWKETLELAQAILEQRTAIYLKNFDDAIDHITGSIGGLSQLEADYEWYEQTQERYVSTSKELYEMAKLNRQINDSIADSTTKTSKARLKALQEEINAMADKNQLTEYDIKMMQLQYKHALALQELEEAKNAKSIVRLTRDENGNYGYQYTANDDDISDARQKVDDALQEINELAADRVQELERKQIETLRNYYDQVAQINADTTLSDEERMRKLEELTAHCNDELLWIRTQYNNAETALLENQKHVQDRYGESIEANTGRLNDQLNAQMRALIMANVTTSEDLAAAIAEGGDLYNALTSYGNIVNQANQAAGHGADDAASSWDQLAGNVNAANTAITTIQGNLATVNESLKTEADQLTDNIAKWKDMATAIDKFRENAENIDRDELRKIIQTLAGNFEDEDVGGQGGNGGNGDNEIKYGYTWSFGSMYGTSLGFSTKQKAIDAAVTDIEEQFDEMISEYQTGEDDSGATEAVNRLTKQRDSAIQQFKKAVSKGINQSGNNSIYTYATGGLADFTGPAWLDGTKQSPELVLNTTDTENMLDIIQGVRELINSNVLSMLYTFSGITAPGAYNHAQELQQNVQITAEFPNATDHNEIEQAFEDIINLATQYANRR